MSINIAKIVEAVQDMVDDINLCYSTRNDFSFEVNKDCTVIKLKFRDQLIFTFEYDENGTDENYWSYKYPSFVEGFGIEDYIDILYNVKRCLNKLNEICNKEEKSFFNLFNLRLKQKAFLSNYYAVEKSRNHIAVFHKEVNAEEDEEPQLILDIYNGDEGWGIVFNNTFFDSTILLGINLILEDAFDPTVIDLEG